MSIATSSKYTSPEYMDRVRTAIATLKQDLPTLFEKDISYDIYRSDIEFTDPVNTFKGKLNYRIIYWTLRFHGGLFFTDLHFDLHRIRHVATDIIMAYWTVRGTLRLPWKPRIYFDGASTYKLDEEGFIYDHEDTWDRSPREILNQFFRKGS